jgi:fatty acid desaturase
MPEPWPSKATRRHVGVYECLRGPAAVPSEKAGPERTRQHARPEERDVYSQMFFTVAVFLHAIIRMTRRIEMHIIEQKINALRNETGAIGWVLLWLLGIPIPILVVLFLLRGCT